MKPYKISVAYDGTDFHGWQIQPHDITIASCLQDSWHKLFGQPISIIGASRTDAGVHALGQVARFFADIPASLDLTTVMTAWNARLPNSIQIRTLEDAPPNFHPCANVKEKTYYYLLFLRRPLPIIARFGWHYRFIDDVCLERFSQCMKLYQGTHNFGSFCKIEDSKVSTIRTINSIRIKRVRLWNALLVTIKGPGFARFQIRRMIGYALDVARQPTLSVEYLKDILDNPNPQQTLLKASGQGLCLRKVIYHDDT